MAEALLVLYLGNEVAANALVGGLNFLVGLKERAETAFAHAKTRTRMLAEAATYAKNFVDLFEGTVEELKGVFDGPKRKKIEAPLLRLKAAVVEAQQLMQQLEGYSSARWFARGNTYREKITRATQYLDSACQQLADVLTGATAEVSLIIKQRVEQLVNDQQWQRHLHTTPHEIAAEESKENETTVSTSKMSQEELEEIIRLVNEEHVRFTDRVGVLVQHTSSNAAFVVKELHNANEKYQAISVIVTSIRNKLRIHSDVRESMHLVYNGALVDLDGGITKAFKMIDTAQDSKRAEQVQKATGMINAPLQNFREALRLLDDASKRLVLSADKPALTAAVSVTLAELLQLLDNFSDTVDRVLADYARNPNTDQAQLFDYFTGTLDKLHEELGQVLNAERHRFAIDVHRFLRRTKFEVEAPQPEQVDDEPDTGKTELESDADNTGAEEEEEDEEVEYPDADSGPSDERLKELVDRAKQRAAAFFERKGRKLMFRKEPIKQEDIQALLLDLEILEVFVRGLQMKATVHLEEQVLKGITGLAEVFGALPRAVAAPVPGQPLAGVQEQLAKFQQVMETVEVQTAAVSAPKRERKAPL